MSVTSGKKKASVRKETVAVSDTIPKIVRKNQNTLPPHLPSQPFREVEVCQRREASEAKVTMGACTRTPCEYWHPPECQFYKTKTGCKSGDTCLFPHHKVVEQPNKRMKKGYFPKRRESEDKRAVAIVKSVSQLGCVLQDLDALDSQGTNECRGNPMHKVLNAIQRVRFTESTPCHASILDD